MKRLLIPTFIAFLNVGANSQTLQSLQDINKPLAYPFEYLSTRFYTVHDKILFYGLTLDQGYGFWNYDGKDAKMISSSGSTERPPAETADGFYFISQYDVEKYSLYKHGGNPGVSFLIDDLTTNTQNNVPTIAALNDKVFYPNWDDIHGYELWCAKDSAGSGALVLDGTPGIGGTFPFELTKADDLVYYRGGGYQLWRSDGTAAGTFKLLQITPNNQYIQANSLRTIGNKVYFLVRKLTGDTEFWVSDGTVPGTMKLTDVPSSYAAQDRFEAFFLDGKYVYLSVDAQNSKVKWAATDGTPNGTELLLNLPSNTDFFLSFYDSETVKSILNGSFFFFCKNNSTTEYELWKSNGTAMGTEKVKSLGNSSAPQTLASSNQLFFFLAQNKVTNDIELWSSDGTILGTKLTKSLGVLENYLYFGRGEATDSTVLFYSPFYGPDIPGFPYRSDGTEQGTYPVEGKLEEHLAGSDPNGFVSGPNDAVFFRAHDNRLSGIWQTGAAMPYDITRIDSTGDYSNLEFGTPMPANGNILWFSNDTTLKVMDANGTVSQINLPLTYAGFWGNGPGNNLYFLCKGGQSLWRSNGTLAGTYELLPAPFNSTFYDLQPVGDSLYFLQGINGANQSQYLWVSDGSTAGTQKIDSMITGSTIFLREVQNRLAFSTYGINPYSRSLFVQGFPSVYFDGYFDDDFAGLAIADGKLFVLGSKTYNPTDSLHYPFWVIENGTPTVLQKFQAIVGNTHYNPWNKYSYLQSLQEKTILGAGLKADDVELWTSDGTSAGTYQLRDLNPFGSSNPDNFVRYNDGLWLFTANDGTEVSWWATNGTWDGTFKVAALATVKDYFVPLVENAYLNGNRLFFSMNDGIIGQEPWVMVLEDSLVVSTIAPLLQANDFAIWPNPAHGYVNLTLESEAGKPAWIELLDNAGQLVYRQKHEIPNAGPITIRLTQQSKGNHFLKITTENGKIWTKKLIIAE
jgi:ELWxxDGT repeat protein